MQRRIYGFSLWRVLLSLAFLSTFLILVSFSMGPDSLLEFKREIPSKLLPDRLERNIGAVSRWSEWIAMLGEAKIVGTGDLQDGAIIQLFMDPKKGKSKQYQLTLQVLEYRPAELLRLRVIGDSTQRIPHLFEDLEWKIAIKPLDQGSLLIGSASAKTRHWKSRLFGKFAEKIMMHQLFLPNVIKLAGMKQPFGIEDAAVKKATF